MRKLPVPVLTAALTCAALLAVGTASPALASHIYIGYGNGNGATSQAAESAAITNLNVVNSDCLPGTVTLVYDTQQSSGIWAAEVSAKCLTPGT